MLKGVLDSSQRQKCRGWWTGAREGKGEYRGEAGGLQGVGEAGWNQVGGPFSSKVETSSSFPQLS